MIISVQEQLYQNLGKGYGTCAFTKPNETFRRLPINKPVSSSSLTWFLETLPYRANCHRVHDEHMQTYICPVSLQILRKGLAQSSDVLLTPQSRNPSKARIHGTLMLGKFSVASTSETSFKVNAYNL